MPNELMLSLKLGPLFLKLLAIKLMLSLKLGQLSLKLLAIEVMMFLKLLAIELMLSLKLDQLSHNLLEIAPALSLKLGQLSQNLLAITLMLSLKLLKNSGLTINLTLQHGRNIYMPTRPSRIRFVRTLDLASSPTVSLPTNIRCSVRGLVAIYLNPVAFGCRGLVN